MCFECLSWIQSPCNSSLPLLPSPRCEFFLSFPTGQEQRIKDSGWPRNGSYNGKQSFGGRNLQASDCKWQSAQQNPGGSSALHRACLKPEITGLNRAQKHYFLGYTKFQEFPSQWSFWLGDSESCTLKTGFPNSDWKPATPTTNYKWQLALVWSRRSGEVPFQIKASLKQTVPILNFGYPDLSSN